MEPDESIPNDTRQTPLAANHDGCSCCAQSLFPRRFIQTRPLLAAISSPLPVVLLVDEIDKADPEFEAFLLELLSDFQVTIPELGTIRAQTHPFVFLTSNNYRDMSDALK